MNDQRCTELSCENTASHRCSGCQRAYYCSLEHQHHDRQRHKGFCKAIVQTNANSKICHHINRLLDADPELRRIRATVLRASSLSQFLDARFSVVALVFHRDDDLYGFDGMYRESIRERFRMLPECQIVTVVPRTNNYIAYPNRHEMPVLEWTKLPRPYKSIFTHAVAASQDHPCSICKTSARGKRICCRECSHSVCVVCCAKMMWAKGEATCRAQIEARSGKSIPFRCPICRDKAAVDGCTFTNEPRNTLEVFIRTIRDLAMMDSIET